MAKTKDYSPSVAALLIGAPSKKAPGEDAEKSKEDDGEGAAWTAFGKALRLANESKDDAAIGQALKDAISYCMPEEGE